MITSAIIVLREMIEMSLLISITLAATKDISGRKPWIISSIIVGILSSIIIGSSLIYSSNLFSGSSLDIFNAAILTIANMMIIYTILAMKDNTKKFSQDMKSIYKSQDTIYLSIFTLISLAILREGSEIFIFLYGTMISFNQDISSVLLGSLIGGSLGVLLGFLIYFGIVRLPFKLFFTVTTILLTFLTANISSQIVNLLISAEILQNYTNPIFNLSQILDVESIIFKISNSFFGINPSPSPWHIISYFGTLMLVPILVYTKNSER